MPYPVVPGAVLEVAIEGTQNGQQLISLFHYRLEAGGSLPDGAAAILTALAALNVPGGLVDKYQDCISDEVIDLQVYGQWITPDRYRYLPAPGAPFGGNVAAPPLPVNVAVAVTKFGEQANRKNLGTLHMPAVPVTFVAQSAVTLAGLLAYDALADKIPEPIVLGGGNTLRPCLFNRLAPSTSAIIVGAFVQTESRVMRRRTVGVGA